jgi:hypothetical protein
MRSVLLVPALLAAPVFAQSNEFERGMKAAMDALAKMDRKTGPPAIAAGERLGSLYENLIPFWRQRAAADAVKISEQGKSAALMLASGAFGGDENKANEAVKTLGGTCKSCHDAHRERTPDGKFKVK